MVKNDRHLSDEMLEQNMYVIAEFSVVPIGVGVSLSKYVAACEVVLQESGVKYELHANGTNLEGVWDEVVEVIRKCHEKLHEMEVPRISTIIKIGTRTDREQKMRDKIESVRGKLAKEEGYNLG